MKKLLLVCFALCVVTLTVSAQGDNEAEIRHQIESAAVSMKTMQCDFVQTKYLRMLNDKMVSTGKMYYQQSDKLRWEYTSPYTYAFVLNGSKVLISKGSRSDVINVNQSKFFKEIARIMMNSVVGKALNDKRDFKVSISATSSEYVATLIPQQKQLQQMFQKIILHFNRQQAMVAKVELIEKRGDRTVIEMKHVKVGTVDQLPLQDSIDSKTRYATTIEISKGYLSGISVLVREADVYRGVLFNEFGITALEFTYDPQKKKIKLEQVIAMLDKWYIRRVLRNDLRCVMENLMRGISTYKDEKYHISYKFSRIEDKTGGNTIEGEADGTEE